MNPEDIARAVSLMIAQGSANLIAQIVRESTPTRDEIALRFAVALAAGSWANPNDATTADKLAPIAFTHADAFLAARDGAR